MTKTIMMMIVKKPAHGWKPRPDVDDLWHTVQPGPSSEKQAQCSTLQYRPVAAMVTEWIECSRLNHGNYAGNPLTTRVNPRSWRGAMGKEEEDS